MATWIVTDVGCDLPIEYVRQQEFFYVIPMVYRMDGEEKEYQTGDEKEMPAFYQRLRGGSLSTTSQINQETYYTLLRKLTENGDEVLCLPLSGGVSGTLQSAQMARAMLLEENKNARVYVEDTLSGSMGQGLLVDRCLKKRAEGLNAEQLAKWVRDNRQRIIHWFTVDDLDFLFRGGRLSRSSALMGSMLHIKPVLHVNWEGRIVPQEKVQGRKKALRRLAEKAAEGALPKDSPTVFISHSDCEADALYVRDIIREALPTARFLISLIGCVLGSHSGPGAVAVFFFGEGR